jgi:hypothetical protein
MTRTGTTSDGKALVVHSGGHSYVSPHVIVHMCPTIAYTIDDIENLLTSSPPFVSCRNHFLNSFDD